MSNKPNTSPLIIAGATIFSALIAAALAALATFIRTGDYSVNHLAMIPVFFVFSLFAVTIVGLPLYFTARKFNFHNWHGACLFGVLGGALISVIIRLPSSPLLNDFLVNCPIGVATALTFWFFTRHSASN